MREIARVKLNGRDLGVRFMPPYDFPIPAGVLKEKGNVLEVEVTNLIKVMGNGYGRQCGEAIAVDPDDPKTIYAGGDVTSTVDAKSALIKSTDGGLTWEPVIGYDDLGLFDATTKYPTWTDTVVRCVAEGEYQTQNGVAAIAITGGKVYVGTSKNGTANVHVASVKDDKFSVLSKELPTEFYPSRINLDPNGDLLITYMADFNFGGSDGGAFRYHPADGTVTQLFKGAGLGSMWADPENPDHIITSTCGKFEDQEWQPWTDEVGAVWGYAHIDPLIYLSEPVVVIDMVEVGASVGRRHGP